LKRLSTLQKSGNIRKM